ncbi:hypothetical protein HPK19_06195 [Arthrobacter citreus]|nr:hypothetical protein HPK19_06195 [Arthrobacter citreus]
MEFRSSGRLSNFLVVILFSICLSSCIFYVQKHGFPSTPKSYCIIFLLGLMFLAYVGYIRSMVIRINENEVTYEHWGFKRTIPAQHITRVNLQYRYKETASYSAYLVINHPEESLFIPSMMFQGQIDRITKAIRDIMIY